MISPAEEEYGYHQGVPADGTLVGAIIFLRTMAIAPSMPRIAKEDADPGGDPQGHDGVAHDIGPQAYQLF